MVQPTNPTIQIVFLAMQKVPVDIPPHAYAAMTLHIDRVVVQLKRSATAIKNYTGRQASSPDPFFLYCYPFLSLLLSCRMRVSGRTLF